MGTLHGSFIVPLDVAHDPAVVFGAFSDLEIRRRWYRVPGPSSSSTHELDFRVGGTERVHNLFVSGDQREDVENLSRFIEIAPVERIVFAYSARVNSELRWASLVTVEFTPTPWGTHLDWTEQYAFVRLSSPDGAADVKHLVGGTRLRFNGLPAALA